MIVRCREIGEKEWSYVERVPNIEEGEVMIESLRDLSMYQGHEWKVVSEDY